MSDRATVIEVCYPVARGTLGLRGHGGGLSWDETMPPTRQEGDISFFELRLGEHELVELKIVRNDDDWAAGRNFYAHAGDYFTIEPCFDRTISQVVPMEPVMHEGLAEPIAMDVLLPPSYDEQDNKRYPVLYVLDGQSLWSFSNDPFGVWNLEHTLDRLFELGAVEEIIVVALRTDRDRIGLLSPMPDPTHGGGQGPTFLAAIVETVKPRIDERFRTYTDRENTAILGSSMGGLFAFYAAWSRPDVFGKSACLSSSFWWAQRGMIKLVQTGACPYPRPQYYIDSGASFDPAEQNPNLRDGYHHTRSMVRAMLRHCYQAGSELHRLTFTGNTHDAPSWAARVGIPMQILFPKAPPGEITEARD